MQRSEHAGFEQQRPERRSSRRSHRRRSGGDGTVTTGGDAAGGGGVTGAHAFTGPDLATVLAEVMDRLGNDAVILAATKVRGGGVGGFFAKERFEVLAAPAVAAPGAGARAGGLPWDDGGDAEPAAGAPEGPAARPVPRRRAARAVPDRLVASTGHVDALLALADAVSVTDRRAPQARIGAAAGSGPATAPEEQSFGAFLAAAVGRPDIIDLADRAVTASPGTAPLPVRPSVTVPRRRVPVLERPDPDRASPTRPALPEVDRTPLPEIVVAHTRDGRRLARLRPAFTEVPRLTRAEARAATEAALAVRAPAPDRAAERALRPTSAVASSAAASAMIEPVRVEPVRVEPVRVGPVRARAATVADQGGRPTSSTSTLPWVPEPSLALPGIVLLLGDDAALRAARRLAEAAGRDPADVVVAAPVRPIDVRAWSWVRDADEAARRQARWLSRPEAVVVAVVVPADDAGVSFAAAVHDALDADHVRVVVSAPAACWTPLYATAHAVDVA